MALGWAALMKLAMLVPYHLYTMPLVKMCLAGVGINLALMALNLLPLPPLDGGRIAVSLLPYRLAVPFSRLERWSFPILLLLLFTHILDLILLPLINVLMRSILFFFGLY
jgi:Zn-dependent protease